MILPDDPPRVLTTSAPRGGPSGLRMVIAVMAAVGLGAALGFVLASGGDHAATLGGSTTRPVGVESSSPFTHSEPGAVSALASSVERYSLETLVHRNEAKASFEEIGTRSFARSELAKWDRAAATEGGRALARAALRGKGLAQTVPLRYAIDSYDRDSAVMRLWSATFLAGRGLSPSAQFSIDRATLVWDRDRWRLDSLKQLREGPTPGALISELTRSSGSLVQGLSGFREVRHAP